MRFTWEYLVRWISFQSHFTLDDKIIPKFKELYDPFKLKGQKNQYLKIIEEDTNHPLKTHASHFYREVTVYFYEDYEGTEVHQFFEDLMLRDFPKLRRCPDLIMAFQRYRDSGQSNKFFKSADLVLRKVTEEFTLGVQAGMVASNNPKDYIFLSAAGKTGIWEKLPEEFKGEVQKKKIPPPTVLVKMTGIRLRLLYQRIKEFQSRGSVPSNSTLSSAQQVEALRGIFDKPKSKFISILEDPNISVGSRFWGKKETDFMRAVLWLKDDFVTEEIFREGVKSVVVQMVSES